MRPRRLAVGQCKIPRENRMAAQDTTKTYKNAKERRERKKQSVTAPESNGSGDGTTSVSKRSVAREGASVTSAGQRSWTAQAKSYLKGVIAESRRVTWPGKAEVIAGTVTTTIILLASSVFLGGLDVVLGRLTSSLGF